MYQKKIVTMLENSRANSDKWPKAVKLLTREFKRLNNRILTTAEENGRLRVQTGQQEKQIQSLYKLLYRKDKEIADLQQIWKETRDQQKAGSIR